MIGWSRPEDAASLLAPSAAEQGSGEWWRDRLLARIEAERPELERLSDYYEGRHPLAFATSKYREAFGRLLKPLRDDWMQIVVDAAVERLTVDGFRFGEAGEDGDRDAWSIWQANSLDARSVMAHTEAVKLGRAYLVTGPGEAGEPPRIITEHPLRAAVEEDPARPDHRLAGLQRFVDPFGVEHCIVWTPEARWEWTRSATTRQPQEAPVAGAWELVSEGENPVGRVPIVALPNRPSLSRPEGRSDLAGVIPLQDAVNKLIADLMVASEFSAFRQRWATGIEIPTDPESGEALADQWISAISRVWTVEDEGAKFGEFSATDLRNYTEATETLIRHIAAQTRTPPHYLLGEVINTSAEALKAAEAGLVSRVRMKQLGMGDGWEEAMRLAFAWQGDLERAADKAAEVIWRDPETRTQAETVDAATKLATLGVPREALWARIPGVTPQMITRWRAMAAQEAREAALAGAIGGFADQGDPTDGSSPLPPGGGQVPSESDVIA